MTGIEKQVDKLIERLADTSSPLVAQAIEAKVDELERRKLIAAEKLENAGAPKHTFGKLFEPAMAFLASPWKIWDSGSSGLRRLVLRLAFSERRE
ncbi:MAG: hypothetical protein AAF334_06410 [Pseudomonadota bacterium]